MTTFTREDFDKAIGKLDDNPPEAGGDGLSAEEQAALETAEAAGKIIDGEGEKKEEKVTPPVLEGDGVPEELKGKTPEEAIKVYEELKTLSQGLAARVQEGQKAPPPELPKAPAAITADDLVEDNAKGFNDKFGQMFDHKITPLMRQVVQGQAQSNRTAALAQSDVLKTYQSTMDRLILENNLDDAALAQPGTWGVLEGLVFKAHGNDIATARARELSKPEPELSVKGEATLETTKATAASLSAVEKSVADGLGVGHDAYAAMKQYTNQG